MPARTPLLTLHPDARRVAAYFRTFTARATTSATVDSDTAAWSIIVIFAQRDSGKTSVGLNAEAFVKDKKR